MFQLFEGGWQYPNNFPYQHGRVNKTGIYPAGNSVSISVECGPQCLSYAVLC